MVELSVKPAGRPTSKLALDIQQLYTEGRQSVHSVLPVDGQQTVSRLSDSFRLVSFQPTLTGLLH